MSHARFPDPGDRKEVNVERRTAAVVSVIAVGHGDFTRLKSVLLHGLDSCFHQIS